MEGQLCGFTFSVPLLTPIAIPELLRVREVALLNLPHFTDSV